jgi:acid phosphatase (class A)
MLMEVMPDKADLILRELNEFAYNRTICRYHWTSDTINGRIVGAVTSAILRAAKDFDELLETAKSEL